LYVGGFFVWCIYFGGIEPLMFFPQICQLPIYGAGDYLSPASRCPAGL